LCGEFFILSKSVFLPAKRNECREAIKIKFSKIWRKFWKNIFKFTFRFQEKYDGCIIISVYKKKSKNLHKKDENFTKSEAILLFKYNLFLNNFKNASFALRCSCRGNIILICRPKGGPIKTSPPGYWIRLKAWFKQKN